MTQQEALISTDSGGLACQNAAAHQVFRVGYEPEPWVWTPWQYADAGHFSGRWDDPNGVWRTIYVGQTPLACYLEVLAPFRPDPRMHAELADIAEDPVDSRDHPTTAAGTLPRRWSVPRRIATARLGGWHAMPGHVESLPTLRARFLPLAHHQGLPDVDAAAIRHAEPRDLTQAIAAWVYDLSGPDGHPVAGIRFDSRHGDRLGLWAIFERPGDGDSSPHLHGATDEAIDPDDPNLVEAMRIHRLAWST